MLQKLSFKHVPNEYVFEYSRNFKRLLNIVKEVEQLEVKSIEDEIYLADLSKEYCDCLHRISEINKKIREKNERKLFTNQENLI